MRDGPFLILHGLEGSGPEHWQSWIAARLAENGAAVDYPDLPDPFSPAPDAWMAALDAALGRMGDARAEATVLCHSLSCTLWLHHAARSGQAPVGRVLLAAPPSPNAGVEAILPFFPVPLDPAAVARAAGETLLVCSSGDPYCPEGASALYGDALRVPVHALAGAGHINTDTGYGAWPWLETWCYGAKKGVET